MGLDKGYRTKHQSGTVQADEVKIVADPPKAPQGVRGHGETADHAMKSKHTTSRLQRQKPE